MTIDPYATPQAPVASPAHEARRRPVWVWVISLYYALSGFSTVVTLPLTFSAPLGVDDTQRAYFESLGPLDFVATVVGSLLAMAFAWSFFRLRARAVPLLIVLEAYTAAFTARAALTSGWIEVVGTLGIATMTVGFLLWLAVLFYALALRRRGVLT